MSKVIRNAGNGFLILHVSSENTLHVYIAEAVCEYYRNVDSQTLENGLKTVTTLHIWKVGDYFLQCWQCCSFVKLKSHLHQILRLRTCMIVHLYLHDIMPMSCVFLPSCPSIFLSILFSNGSNFASRTKNWTYFQL